MPAEKAAPAVDCHAHVFSAYAPAVPGARYRPDYGADVKAWRGLWPDAGITHGVLVQPSFFGTDNRELLDTLAADTRHLRGVAVLTPFAADDTTLERFHAAGVRGIRLNLRGVKDYGEYATKAWCELYDRIHARGWHLECYCEAGRLTELTPALERTPIGVVLDHFGVPGKTRAAVDATFAAVQRLARSREVWCKLSAPYRLDGAVPRELAERWLDAVGPARLVWGSDWPWTGFEGETDYAASRAMLDEWIDASLTRAVLWDNAARLYGFE
ncbi:MAG: amidohydrolase family protein [Usitatibacter sp.]